MATRIKFNAPAHHTLEVGDQVIAGGTEAEVSDAQAKALSRSPHVDVSLPDENERPPLADLKRSDLDVVAAELGVESPEALPNKDSVIEAIEAVNDNNEEAS